MRKLVISVLLSLAAAASLKPSLNAFADARFDVSEDRDGLNIDAYLPGSDGVRRKFTLVAEDTEDGVKLSVDLPGGEYGDDIEIEGSSVKEGRAFHNNIEWEAGSVIDGEFNEVLGAESKGYGKIVYHEAQLNLPNLDFQADFEETYTVDHNDAFTDEKRFAYNDNESAGEVVSEMYGTISGNDRQAEVAYEGKYEWNFAAQPTNFISVGALNLKQCLNVCFDGCKLSDNNCFQSCSSNCLALNAEVEPVATADSTPAPAPADSTPAPAPAVSTPAPAPADSTPVNPTENPTEKPAENPTEKPAEDSSSSSSKTWIIVGVVAVVAVLAVGGFFVYRHKKSDDAKYHQMP